MNRIAVMFATVLLLIQTVFSGVTGAVLTEVKAENKVLSLQSINEVNDRVEMGINWTVNQNGVTEGYAETLSLEEEVPLSSDEEAQLVFEATSGDLSFDDVVVGDYSLSDSGSFKVSFNEKVEAFEDENLSGNVAVSADVIVEKPAETDGNDEATSDDEATKNENVQNEVKENAEKVDNEKKTTGKVNDGKKTSKSSRNIQLLDVGEGQFKFKASEILDKPGGTAYGDDKPLNPNDPFWLRFDWELEDNHGYKSGDQETIQLPPQIKINEPINDGEMKDGFGNLVATYTVDTNGVVTITFTDYVEEHSNVKGWLEIYAEIDKGNVEEDDDGYIVIGTFEDEGELRIPIVRTDVEKMVEKQGEPNKFYNADEIEWTVTLNKSGIALKGAAFEDVLPDGTEFIDGSMKIVKQKTTIDGTPIGSPEDVTDYQFEKNGDKISAQLGDIRELYIITYKTKVSDFEKKTFKNNVTFSDSELKDLGAHATVTINRGDPLNKGVAKNYDPKTGIIEWYLEFNYDQKNLQNVTLEDNWTPAGKVELVDGSVKFQEMKIDENGHASAKGKSVDANEVGNLEKVTDGFKVSNITTDKPYRITYQTKVNERVLDGFEIKNFASFGDHKKGSNHNVGQYVGKKSAGEIDYAKKTIDWTIEINMDEKQMDDVIITDTLGSGLTLLKDTVKVTIDGEEKQGINVSDPVDNKFTITNIGDVNKKIVVTYQTNYNPNKLEERKDGLYAVNKANVSWIPEGSSERINRDYEASKKVNKQTQDSSWKDATYNPETKEITWTIIANYRENAHDDFKIIDTPKGNQEIVAGSVKVNEIKIESDGSITEGTTVTGKDSTDDGTITVNIGATNKAYKVTYKTTVEGLNDLNKTYENKATVKDGDTTINELTASVDVYGETKYGTKAGQQDGKQIHWSIDVNPSQQLIKDLKLKDTITSNQEYLTDTIKVYEAKIENENDTFKTVKGDPVSEDAYTLNVEDDHFTIEWKENVERAFIVEYSTLFFAAHEETVGNDYEITGDSINETDGDSSGSGEVTIKLLSSGGGSGEAGFLRIKKLDTTHGEEIKPIEGIEFILIDPDTGKVLKTGTTDSEGYIEFGRLLFGNYLLKEVNTPDGYEGYGTQTIEINEKYNAKENPDLAAYTLKVENYKPNYDIELLKLDDEENLLADAEFTLFNEHDEEIETQTTNSDGKITFDNVEPGNYYVQETKAPAGYLLDDTKHEVEITKEQKEPIQLEIHNEIDHTYEKTEVSVKKEWKGHQEEEEITVHLLADGEKVATQTLSDTNNWQHVFEDLQAKNSDGTPITYEVEEVKVDGYKSEITGSQESGFTIINTRSGKTEVNVEKIWQDNDADERPGAIKVKLLQNGEEIQDADVTASANWTYTFADLEEFDSEGVPYEYTVEEVDVKGYVSKVTGSQEDGFTITNTRTGETEVTITKSWKDENEADRPNTIKVNLHANDEITVHELTAENDWTLTIGNLPKYDDEGAEIVYTITEHDVPGYKSEIDGLGITNIRSDKKDIEITKTWLDDDSEDRPSEIKVDLFRSITDGDDEFVDTYTVSADDWTLVINDLPSFDENGKAYTYSIKEQPVEGYESTIDGFDITNLRTGTTSVKGTKSWDEVDPQYRPDEVTIQLLANGEEKETTVASEETNWKYSFEDLAKYDDAGKVITYTVKEIDIPTGYVSEVDGFDITNTQKTTEISGTKTWKDKDENARPGNITIQLKIGNEVIAEQEIASDETNFIFKDLPKYDKSGEEINYTVDEVAVDGYEKFIDGYDITNVRTGTTDITINKTWKDDDNAKGHRPDSIKVDLFRSIEGGDKEKVDTFTITDKDKWSLTIGELPAFDEEGRAYTYEIDEHEVSGYETSIDGFDITNTFIEEEVPANGGDQDKEKEDKDKGGILPKTATQIFSFIALGLGLTALGIVISVTRRRKEA